MSRQKGPLPFSFDGIEFPDELPPKVPDRQDVFLIEDETANHDGADNSLAFNWAEEMPWEDVGLSSPDESPPSEEAEMDRLFGPLRG